jgi:hypothetical protein
VRERRHGNGAGDRNPVDRILRRVADIVGRLPLVLVPSLILLGQALVPRNRE